jgi:hypothetical protein
MEPSGFWPRSSRRECESHHRFPPDPKPFGQLPHAKSPYIPFVNGGSRVKTARHLDASQNIKQIIFTAMTDKRPKASDKGFLQKLLEWLTTIQGIITTIAAIVVASGSLVLAVTHFAAPPDGQHTATPTPAPTEVVMAHTPVSSQTGRLTVRDDAYIDHIPCGKIATVPENIPAGGELHWRAESIALELKDSKLFLRLSFQVNYVENGVQTEGGWHISDSSAYPVHFTKVTPRSSLFLAQQKK